MHSQPDGTCGVSLPLPAAPAACCRASASRLPGSRRKDRRWMELLAQPRMPCRPDCAPSSPEPCKISECLPHTHCLLNATVHRTSLGETTQNCNMASPMDFGVSGVHPEYSVRTDG